MFSPHPAHSPDFAFPLQCSWLKTNGSWPVDSEKSPFGSFYRHWSVFVIFLVGATCVFQMWYMLDNFGDILKVTENCCTSFMGLHTFLRLIHMWLNKKRLKKLMEDFVELIYVARNTDQQIKKRCDKELGVYRFMSAMLFALICMYCILPLFELFSDPNDSEKPFPYKMIFPYSAQRGLLYVLTYVYTSFAGFVAVTTLFAEDSLFGFFITHACGRFKVLHQSIKKLLPDAHSAALFKHGRITLTPQQVQHEYNLHLKKVIQQHNYLIKFCKDLDAFCSPYLLVNFLISSMLICVVGFQLFTVRMSFANSSKFLLYIFSALAQLFVICWSGDKLISNVTSTATAWKLYSCNWERSRISFKRIKSSGFIDSEAHINTDLEFMRHLVFVILRAQQPLRITAMKFSVLSLQSFTKILSTSVSYFTLLQTVYEKE